MAMQEVHEQDSAMEKNTGVLTSQTKLHCSKSAPTVQSTRYNPNPLLVFSKLYIQKWNFSSPKLLCMTCPPLLKHKRKGERLEDIPSTLPRKKRMLFKGNVKN